MKYGKISSPVNRHKNCLIAPPKSKGAEGRGHFNREVSLICIVLSGKVSHREKELDKEWYKEYKVASMSYIFCEIIHKANRKY